MLVIKEEKDREESRGTEGARRATGVAREAAEFNGVGADPEVADKATRRQLSAKYKRRIVREADRCTKPGELGALLRREGLFSSALSTWRRQREAGELEGLRPAKGLAVRSVWFGGFRVDTDVFDIQLRRLGVRVVGHQFDLWTIFIDDGVFLSETMTWMPEIHPGEARCPVGHFDQVHGVNRRGHIVRHYERYPTHPLLGIVVSALLKPIRVWVLVVQPRVTWPQ